MLDGAAIAVRGDRIMEIGPAPALLRRYPRASRLGGSGIIAIPGMINAHHHLTGDRYIRAALPPGEAPPPPSVEGTGAEVQRGYVASLGLASHAAHTAEDTEVVATMSLLESVGNGITFTVEAGSVEHPASLLAAYDRVGVGGTVGTWGLDRDLPRWALPAGEVIERQAAVLDLTAGHPRVHGWVALVGHDMMSDELVTAASALARERGTGITFHISPNGRDAERYLAATGLRPLVHLERLGVLGPHVLVGHAVHIDDEELAVLLRTGTAVAYCPWAYMKLGQGVSRFGRHADFFERGGRIALGCDSDGAGDAIDILRAGALAAALARDTRLDPVGFGAHEALEMATIRGAEAIGLAHDLGSLEPGKRADIVLIDTTGPAWQPLSVDPVQQLVWGSDGRSVRHVVASGRVVVRDRRHALLADCELQAAADAMLRHRQRIHREIGLEPRARWPRMQVSDAFADTSPDAPSHASSDGGDAGLDSASFGLTNRPTPSDSCYGRT